MKPARATKFNPPTRAVVGTAHSSACIEAAHNLAPAAVDLIELRMDAIRARHRSLLDSAASLGFPLVITARHPAEGGLGNLSPEKRSALYSMAAPRAAALDIELRSARELAEVMSEAKLSGCALILSFHDFEATPPLATLRALARNAQNAGADIFKCACTLSSPSDLLTLHRLLAERSAKSIPIAAMGMGPMGPVSRLLLGWAGSALNYGFIRKPNAPGQIFAPRLKTILDELCTYE